MGASLSSYYTDQSILPLTTGHQKVVWGFPATTVIIRNDESGTNKKVYWSYNDPSLHGVILAGDTFKLTGSTLTQMWLWCDGSGAPNYRVFAEPI